jgi:hypothetical protein
MNGYSLRAYSHQSSGGQTKQAAAGRRPTRRRTLANHHHPVALPGTRVAYAILSFGGFLGIAADHYPIPWPMLDYDEELGAYRVDITKEQLKSAPKIEQGKAGSNRTGTATRRSMDTLGATRSGARAPNFIPDHKRQGGGNAGL